MSPVKVAFVTTGMDTGGAEVMLLKLVNSLDKQKVSVTVIVLGSRTARVNELERAGVEVVVLELRPNVAGLLRLTRLPSLTRTLSPDLLQGWMVHGNIAAALTGLALRIPVIWGIRQSHLIPGKEKPLSRLLYQVMKHLSRLPARIIYNSEHGKSHHEALGYSRARSVVIPNGFDVSQFSPDQSARARQRSALGISADTVAIGMLARFHPMKDHSTFLEAAHLVRQRHPDVAFVLVGRGCEPSNPSLQVAVQRLRLEDVVFLAGERTDIPEITNAFDVGTLSSVSEGFPNAIGEIMACGIPCVVTDVGDARSIVGPTGIAVPSKNPSALAEAWGRMIELGPRERARMGEQARARIVALFPIGEITSKYEAVYLDSVHRRGY